MYTRVANWSTYLRKAFRVRSQLGLATPRPDDLHRDSPGGLLTDSLAALQLDIHFIDQISSSRRAEAVHLLQDSSQI